MAAISSSSRYGRSISSRRRGRNESDENIPFDYTKDPSENIREILIEVVKQRNVSKTKKIACLNAFVKILHKNRHKNINLGFSNYQILLCLHIGLYHESKEVRAATLRAIRYLINVDCIDDFFNLHMDYLVARSIDIYLDNEIERIHALRLIRKICIICSHKLKSSLVFPLIAIAKDGSQERDRVVNISVATLCELVVRQSEAAMKCGAVNVILSNVVNNYLYPRINECLISTLIFLLNSPETRKYLHPVKGLEQILAPFTDCHYKYTCSQADSQIDETESVISASKMASLTVMHSWPGLISICGPDSQGLQSLISVLYVHDASMRRSVLNLLYDLFQLPIPKWTSDFTQALLSIDPCTMQEDWSLMNGFVVSEGRALLPHLSKCRTNLVDNHLAFLLSAWISAGLFEALVNIVISSENELFVFSVILLGQLQYLAGQLLPDGYPTSFNSLTLLLSHSTSITESPSLIIKRNEATSRLNRIHVLKKRGLRPFSSFLNHIVQRTLQTKFQLVSNLSFLQQPYYKSSDETFSLCLQESNVTDNEDYTKWNWDYIIAVLQWLLLCSSHNQEQYILRFLRQLVHFYYPRSNQYSGIPLDYHSSEAFTTAGCYLLDVLGTSKQNDRKDLLINLFEDISHMMSEVLTHKPAYDAHLCISNLTSTLVSHYFILIGHLSSTPACYVLQHTSIFEHLLKMVSMTTTDVYMKLAISCLDYSNGGMPLVILSKAVNSASEAARLYATKFLHILLRAEVPNFSKWGMELLITQLYDTSRPVAMTALSVIEEACEDESYLHSLIKMSPSLLHLGDRGAMMVCRFMSTKSGFKSLYDANYVTNELQRWHKTFNMKYVHIVEELLNEAFTTYERTYDGSYTRRSSKKQAKKDVYVPFHLYGQLIQHQEGFNLLRSQKYMTAYFDCLRMQCISGNTNIINLKTSLWVLGHIGSSVLGVTWLVEENVIPSIVYLAENCPVLSIRGTALYVLGLIAGTRKGCSILAQYKWISVWHSRSTSWPPIVTDDPVVYSKLDKNMNVNQLLDYSQQSSYDSSVFSDYTDSVCIELPRKNTDSASCELPPINSDSAYGVVLRNNSDSVPGDATRRQPPSTSQSSRRFTSPKNSCCNAKISPSNDAPATLQDDVLDCLREESDEVSPDNKSKQTINLAKRRKSIAETNAEMKEKFFNEYPTNFILPSHQSFSEFSSSATADNECSYACKTNSSNNSVLEENLSPHIQISYTENDSNCRGRSSLLTKPEQIMTRSYDKSTSDRDKNTSAKEILNNSDSEAVKTAKVTSSILPGNEPSNDIQNGHNQILITDDLVINRSLSDMSESLVSGVRDKCYDSNSSASEKSEIEVSNVETYCNRPNYLSPYSLYSSSYNPGILPSPTVESLNRFQTNKKKEQRKKLSLFSSLRRNASSLRGQPAPQSFSYNLMDVRPRCWSDAAHVHSTSSNESLDTDISFVNYPYYKSRQQFIESISKAESGQSEFVGICLPLSLKSMLTVNDNSGSPSYTEGSSTVLEELNTDMSKSHNVKSCLICYDDRLANTNPPASPVLARNDSFMDDIVGLGVRKLRSESTNTDTTCSSSDSSHVDTSGIQIPPDDVNSGQLMIRKELMRFMLNLASTIGSKSAEQGLLTMKQKFPAVFRDICIYSDVSFFMATYSFRLNARRFIQELFDDLDIEKLFHEPIRLLQLSLDSVLKTSSPPLEMDDFSETFTH